VGVTGTEPLPIGISRFVTENSAKYLGMARPGEWQAINLHGADAAPERWRLFTEGEIEICPL
jgi:hypothetical protein